MLLKNMILLSSFLLSANVLCDEVEKVIYGVDNRRDVYETKNPLYKTLAASTAAMISDSSLEVSGDNVTVKGGNLIGDGVCADERFAKQLTAANCSGFLVGPDLLLTAGHCIQSMSDCDSFSWVFDFANTTKENSSFVINKKNVYKCTSIVSRTLDDGTDNDYALVKLDRSTDRAPLKFRVKGKVSSSTGLVVIGHPSGLPTKVADGAFVRSNKNKYYFQANLDTYAGNSGSAVLNCKTGVVEGILVRGERDFVYDSDKNCYRSKVCKMSGCRGEDVTRITNIDIKSHLK